MASLSDKAVILIIDNVFKYAVGFILPMVLVRFLSQYDYGTYQQLSLVATFCTNLMVLGLPTSVYYFYHHRSDRAAGRATLIAQTAVMLLGAGAVTALVVALAAPGMSVKMNDPALAQLLPPYALYIGMYIAGGAPSNTPENPSGATPMTVTKCGPTATFAPITSRPPNSAFQNP